MVAILERNGLDGMLIRSREHILYLTGFKGSEGTLLVTPKAAFLFTDSRYITYARETVKHALVIELEGKGEAIAERVSDFGLKRIGFDSRGTSYETYEAWKKRFGEVELIPVGKEIEEIRSVKEKEEVERIRTAVKIAETAFFECLGEIREGQRERDIALELDYRMARRGAQAPSFQTIVASGERSALPHAFPSDRRLRNGDVIVFDFGCIYEDYCSDETFTVCLGKPERIVEEAFLCLKEAKRRALEALGEGVRVKDVDSVAREFIRERGFGEYFRHGLGHGVGLSVHEPPSITSEGEGVLESHMVFTIEPGIYMPGEFGIRIEDMVVIEGNTVEILTRPKEELIML